MLKQGANSYTKQQHIVNMQINVNLNYVNSDTSDKFKNTNKMFIDKHNRNVQGKKVIIIEIITEKAKSSIFMTAQKN